MSAPNQNGHHLDEETIIQFPEEEEEKKENDTEDEGAGNDEECVIEGNGKVNMAIAEDDENIENEINDKVTTLTRKRGLLVSPNNNNSQGTKFLASIRRKDTQAIKKFQKCPSALYVFCDEYGVSPAETAVLANDISTLDLLIDGAAVQHKLFFIRQAMLFAVRDQNMNLLRHLLSRLNEAKGRLKTSCKKDKLELTENAEFSTEVTPIILAARLNRLDMIQMLEQAGESEIHPVADSIDQSCAKKNCYVCKLVRMKIMKGTVQEYRHSSEVLQAISSPAYIFSRSPDDPILETFRISQLADRLQREDTAFSENYKEIGSGCREFTKDLISLCRSTEEVEVMLKYPNGLEVTNAKGSRAKFPRLQVAIHYAQKPFVAQANCQQVLDQVWNKGLPSWVCKTRFHDLRFLVYSALLCIFMPFAFLIYSLPFCSCPFNRFVESIIKTPVGKLIHDTISYIAFLLLVLLSASETDHTDEKNLSAVDWCIFIWLAGLTARWLKVMYYRRAQLWNCSSFMPTDRAWFIDDISMLVAFWIAYILRFIDMMGLNKLNLDLRAGSEVAFSIASIISIIRILAFFKSADYMGPLVVSLKSIMSPILRFMVLFVLILLAFIIGLSHLPQRNSNYSNIGESFGRLFWNLYGYEEPLSLGEDPVPLSLGRDPVSLSLGGDPVTEVPPEVTSEGRGSVSAMIIGTTLLGAYHVIAIIVLSNILIAMVTNIYNRIEGNSDVEWKFARTQLRMSYFNEVGCLPPPFNLIPARKFIKTMKKIYRKITCCCQNNDYNPEDTWRKCYSPAHAHTALMEKLRRRYRKMKASTEDTKHTDKMLMRLSSRNDYRLDFFTQGLEGILAEQKNVITKKNSTNTAGDYKIDQVTNEDSAV